MSSSLHIPSALRNEILPNPSLSVFGLLKFTLPVVSAAAHNHTSDIIQFLSDEEPTVTDSHTLRCIPISSLSTVQSLFAHIKSESTTFKSRSITCAHLGQKTAARFLPLWIVTYWVEVIDLRGSSGAYTLWKEAEHFLHQRRKNLKTHDPIRTRTVVDRVFEKLATIPWAGHIRGFGNQKDLFCLSTYASTKWLSDVHMNQLLDLLRISVGRELEGISMAVENTYFWKSVCQAYEQREQGTYSVDRHFLRLRRLGEELAGGARNQLAFVVNLANTHWIAVCIDVRCSTIFYGDSLPHSAPDPHVIAVLEWWVTQHISGPVACASMETTCQNDQFSCGLFSWNAIAHHLLPEEFALIPAGDAQDARLEVMLDVIDVEPGGANARHGG